MVMRVLGTLAWAVDELLDRIPRREDGRWYRYGDWGCQLGLGRFYARDENAPFFSKPGEAA